MHFFFALWLRQWLQPSLFYRWRSKLFRHASRRCYRRGKDWGDWGDRFALQAHCDFVRALDASDKTGARR